MEWRYYCYSTKITLCALVKNYLIPKNSTQKIREKTTLTKIKEGRSKAILKYNVPATRLNYGAIHSAESKRMCRYSLCGKTKWTSRFWFFRGRAFKSFLCKLDLSFQLYLTIGKMLVLDLLRNFFLGLPKLWCVNLILWYVQSIIEARSLLSLTSSCC